MNRLSFFTLLLAAASVVAFVLSAVGIYGVVSFLVERRRTELGVRMALGARRGAVQRMVVGESLVLAICGVVAGIGAALAVMKMLQSLLYGVSARDPWTIGLVSVFLLTMAAVASWAPALRASRIPPADVLRQE
jgi:ABC-type antimicrobial peptide transport system permease subunit